MSTAFLLSVLGVSRDWIEADYLLTNLDTHRQADFIESTIGFPEGVDRENMIAAAGVPEEAMRDFLDGHREWMETKSYKEGPLKLLHYTFAEGPEYEEGQAISWAQGKYPKKTGRTIFQLYELYESEEAVHHHWIDAAEFGPVLMQTVEEHKIEVRITNQLTVAQSLWD